MYKRPRGTTPSSGFRSKPVFIPAIRNNLFRYEENCLGGQKTVTSYANQLWEEVYLPLNPFYIGLFLSQWQLDALTTQLDRIQARLDLIHTRLDLIRTRLDLIHTARAHPRSARSNSHSATSHPHSARSDPHSARSHPISTRSHPHSARSHPLLGSSTFHTRQYISFTHCYIFDDILISSSPRLLPSYFFRIIVSTLWPVCIQIKMFHKYHVPKK